MLPFLQPSCYFKTRPPSCALGISFYTVSDGRDLMMYISDNSTSYSAPSPLKHQCEVQKKSGISQKILSSLKRISSLCSPLKVFRSFKTREEGV